MEACDYKGHAVCIACPFQSHITAMLKLAKLLHRKGFHITFVNTEFNHRRFLKSSSSSSSSSSSCFSTSFRFQTIPDGLEAPTDENSNQDPKSLWKSIHNYVMFQPFLDLITKLNDASKANNNNGDNNPPPVTCIISDAFMPFTVKAGQQLGLPVAMFFTIAATNLKYFVLRVAPQQDEGQKDVLVNLAFETAQNISKASAVVVHSFDALEQEALNELSPRAPHLLTIGPLQILLNHVEEQSPLVNTTEYNLWKKETECLEWLDSEEPNSVIYVNFGSSVYVTNQQLVEVGMGLANSNYPFLWVIRPDLVVGDARVLPSEFEDKAKENGFIASWCPQEQVLNHSSVGGYFTHCGWNSAMESLSAGVPMICWPFLGDQPANSMYICRDWGVGIEIGNGVEVNRENIEKLVRELMGAEKGKQMRNKAMEWKRLAEEAAAPGGSSSSNLEKLVNKITKT